MNIEENAVTHGDTGEDMSALTGMLKPMYCPGKIAWVCSLPEKSYLGIAPHLCKNWVTSKEFDTKTEPARINS